MPVIARLCFHVRVSRVGSELACKTPCHLDELCLGWSVFHFAGLQSEALPQVWQVNSSQQPASGKKTGLCIVLELLLSYLPENTQTESRST